jgi:hypothetical protein
MTKTDRHRPESMWRKAGNAQYRENRVQVQTGKQSLLEGSALPEGRAVEERR